MLTPDQLHTLGTKHLYGAKSIEANPATGIEYLDQAAALGHTKAMWDLAVLFLMTAEATKIVPPDTEKGLRYLRMAASVGHTDSMVWLGHIHLQGQRVETDLATARDFFASAAQAGDPQGMYYLGVMAEQGRGAAPDMQAALDWYGRAAKRGDDEAKRALRKLKAKLKADKARVSAANRT